MSERPKRSKRPERNAHRTSSQRVPAGWTRQTGPVVRRHRRRRTLVRLLLALLALAIGAVGIWLVAFSSILELRTARVSGVQGAAAKSVLDAAGLPIGLPLARVDTGAAIAAVANLPWVASVTATRRWPDTVVLTVTSREPVAVQQDTGRAVDASGRAFEPVTALAPSLVVIDAPDSALPAAVAVWLTLPADLAKQVRGMSARTRDDVNLRLDSGALVRWGGPEDGELKAAVLRRLLEDPADVYNVSAPLVPSVVPRRGS